MPMTTRRLAPFALTILALAACNEQQVGTGIERDLIDPVASVLKTKGDTVTVANGIEFAVGAADNLGIKSITVDMAGGYTATLDSVFTSPVTSTQWDINIPLPSNTTAGGTIVITATVTDGNNNTATAVDSIVLTNPAALQVAVVDPPAAQVTSPGRQILVEIRATQRDGVTRVGYTVGGVVTGGDSISFAQPYPDSVDFVDTLDIPSGTATGTFRIAGFGVDSTARRATSTPVTVTVQAVVTDATPPIVTVSAAKRVEVTDSVKVVATDPSGILRVGWTAVDLTGTVVGGDSVTLGGTLTSASRTFPFGFNFATLPQQVVVTGFAVDGNNNRGQSRADTSASAAVKSDTITVVNGVTRALPAGGRVADAIYNPNRNELYLTNVELNRLEVFKLVDTSFVAGGIPVGSRPWGIALWPRDTLGANGDSVIVANSGGTDVSVVDVASRRERRRHALPNFLVGTVQSELDATTGTPKIRVTEYDFSDRPEYLGTVCLPTTGSTNCAADSIYAVYSTTPTEAQAVPFTRRGTVRWENLTSAAPQSHLFWEQAEAPPSPDTDTLQVIAYRQGLAPDTVLSAACGITVITPEVGYTDSTFVRNSGNFTHTLIGEGGAVEPVLGFARVVGHNVTRGIQSFNCSGSVLGVTFTGRVERDLGISPAQYVRDLIGNTATSVHSIAINFNGLTNVLRADSVYLLNEDLRLKGIVSVAGDNPGMDLNFGHSFEAGVGGTAGTWGGSLDPNNRLIFVATPNAEIKVYDTYFFGLVATIPIRDPIIGPLRVARLPTNEQLLIGVTAKGVVTVRLPSITNIFPVAGWPVGGR